MICITCIGLSVGLCVALGVIFFPTPAAGRPQPAVSEGSNGGGITALICVITILNVAALPSGSAVFFCFPHHPHIVMLRYVKKRHTERHTSDTLFGKLFTGHPTIM